MVAQEMSTKEAPPTGRLTKECEECDCGSSIQGCPPFSDLEAAVQDVSQPIGKRTHAAFFLRTLGGDGAVAAIGKALVNREDSALLRHELAYILGQMQNETACATLEQVLRNTSDDCMVRHEAAEALGAIGAQHSRSVLQEFLTDPAPEVSQTCELALDLIAWRQKQRERDAEAPDSSSHNRFLSVDPAPGGVDDDAPISSSSSSSPLAASEDGHLSVEELKQRLCDESASLFSRYRSMFSLRNRGGEAAVLALGEALTAPLERGGAAQRVANGEEGTTAAAGAATIEGGGEGGASCCSYSNVEALFLHEVAYVLGQMQHIASVPALVAVVKDVHGHSMVRHEAAEALGAIGGEEASTVLREALEREGEDVVVVESCQVALDTMDYWSKQEQQGEKEH